MRRELHPTSAVPGSAVPGRGFLQESSSPSLTAALPLRCCTDRCGNICRGRLGTAAGEGRSSKMQWREWWAGHPGCSPRSSSSVCKGLRDVLKPFSKTNTYKRITSLHVFLASKGFVVVSKSQQTVFFLKCCFQPWSWGKMISLMTLTIPATAGYYSPYTSHAQLGRIYREDHQFCCLLARFIKLGPVIFPFNILHTPLNISPLNPQGQHPWDLTFPATRDSHLAGGLCRSNPGVILSSLDLVQPQVRQVFGSPNQQSAIEKVSVSMRKWDRIWSFADLIQVILNLKDVGSAFVQRQVWIWGELL